MGRPKQREISSLKCLAQTLLTPQTHKQAKARAESRGLSMSTYLRTLIINDLENAEKGY